MNEREVQHGTVSWIRVMEHVGHGDCRETEEREKDWQQIQLSLHRAETEGILEGKRVLLHPSRKKIKQQCQTIPRC